MIIILKPIPNRIIRGGDRMWSELSSIISNIFFGIFEDIFKPLTDLNTLNSLVFGNDGEGKLLWLTFTPNEWNNIIVSGVDVTIQIAYYCMLLGIMFMAAMISKAGMNPQTRTNLLEMAGALLFVAFMIRNLDSIYNFFFTINRSAVMLFEAEIAENDLSISKLDNGGFGFLLIWGAYLGLSLWANVYYLMRKFTLFILMILGPIFIALFLFTPFRQVTGNWFRELFSTIMVQSIHAVILWSFLQMDADVTENWVVKLVMLAAFIPIAEGIKALFGLTPALTGKMSVMMMATGAAGLASVFSAAQSAFGKSSFVDRLEDKYMNNRTKAAPGDGGNISGSGTSQGGNNSLQSLPVSKRTQQMLNTGRVAGRFGKSLFTIAGTAAGLPLGPGGTLTGAMVGGKVGQAVGGAVGRFGYATVFSPANQARQNMMEAINEELDQKNLQANYGITPIDEAGTMEGHTTFTPKVLNNLGAKTHAVARGVVKGLTRHLGRVGRTAYNTPAEKRKSIMESGSYLGGVILGDSGLSIGQKITNRIFPEVEQQVRSEGMEYSDFVNQVNKAEIKDVRLAITREFSTVLGKVRNSDGSYTERRITDYRGGDPSLSDGQVVYKDLHIQYGRIADGPAPHLQNRDFYTEDSKGGKNRIDKQYTVNPYDYFQDRNDGSEKYFRPDRFKQGIV